MGKKQGSKEEALPGRTGEKPNVDPQASTQMTSRDLVAREQDRVDERASAAPVTKTDDAAGRWIGSFQVVRKIGEGGMGIVYLARQKSPERHVALKMVRSALPGSDAVRRFQREAEVMGRLQHEGIAQIYEAGSVDLGHGRQPFFAMEFVEGVSLSAAMASMSRKERLDIFVSICDAVAHAHAEGFIHRDLKPGNVMVDRRNRPKVLDFGLARTTQEDSPAAMRTRTGMVLGTLAYMSPEQCGGRTRDLDGRTDVYSLGVMLYEALSERLPYDTHGLTLADALRVIRETEPLPLGSLEAGCRGDLATIVHKALEKEPSRRYGGVSDFQEDLRRFLADEPILARPPSKAYQIRKFARRHRGLVGGLVATFLALVVGSALTTWQAVLATSQRNAVLRLSDVKRLADLRAKANDLWPPYPEDVPPARFEQWLASARNLLDHVPAHLDTLGELRESGTPGEGYTRSQIHEPEATWLFPGETETQWHHGVLVALLEDLGAFDGADGPIADVEGRLSFAQSVRERSLEQHAVDWSGAIESIRDLRKCPHYGGIEISPQIGLVPIGQDPTSGFWEFVHLQTGSVPRRDEDGELVLEEGDGIVLVLLPAGEVWLGSERPETSSDEEGNVDPWSQSDEHPVHRVYLSAFLVSKFEMTQGQWLRLMGQNPSFYQLVGIQRRWSRTGRAGTLLHPVENVSWREGKEALWRGGLALPTEAQWEYAARAGTRTVFWTGDSEESLEGAANLADLFLASYRGQPGPNHGVDDGFVAHAPVGSFRANPFGLHDVLGNVAEWCLDAAPSGSATESTYKKPTREVDGLRLVEVEEVVPRRVYRGGHFLNEPAGLRSANRDYNVETYRGQDLGLRAVWRLRP
jgi:serine/threonine protein kinase/formylglycine-generating enzyme required for sulfatase activity